MPAPDECQHGGHTDTERLQSHRADTPEYAAWLERVEATYHAVAYTCGHRLRDRELGRRVSAAVVAGLIARPGVFRYQGLPYSGRIATLAEGLLAAAREGRPPAGPDWTRLRAALHAVPAPTREVFVLACVHGHRPDEIASRLGCAPTEASRRYEHVLETMRGIGAGEERDHATGLGAGQEPL